MYHTDCAHFRGDIPCTPHKKFSVHCQTCTHYTPRDGWILIIKLGALGDVVRTTPLLHKIRKEYPTKSIAWLTESPDILPQSVERRLAFTPASITVVQAMQFDVIINLDKDLHACALTQMLQAPTKHGFTMVDGKPAPLNEHAEHKFATGVFDDVNQANTKSYPQEIFEICGWEFQGEEYILDVLLQNPFRERRENKHIVGLNTGCGERWISRRWSDRQWIELIRLLQKNNYEPLLLGGKQEHDMNSDFARITGARYDGYFPLRDFISLVDTCDTIVTTVTMGLHIAIGLKKNVILMNNIFNPHEFELYNRGTILQPTKECRCFFKGVCSNTDYTCMDYIQPSAVFDAINNFSLRVPLDSH